MPTDSQNKRLSYLAIAHAMIVLLIGLAAGVMLIFSLLGAVSLWPFPAWEVVVPGTVRGWQAAHVGGILNGVMIAGLAVLMQYLDLSGRRSFWVGWGLIITGWGNTVFYWAGNLAANRGLSVGDTPFGEGDLAGTISFFGGGIAMGFTFLATFILARAAFEKARSTTD